MNKKNGSVFAFEISIGAASVKARGSVLEALGRERKTGRAGERKTGQNYLPDAVAQLKAVRGHQFIL